MDSTAVLAAYDEQVRRRPVADHAEVSVEVDGPVVRHISDGDGWAGVTWADLDELTADEVIAAQIERFAALGRPWEWKHYSYDQPRDLPRRLAAFGFTAEPTETLLVAEVAVLRTTVAEPPDGVTLKEVTDAAGVDALVRVHDEVFGGDHSGIGRSLLAALSSRPPSAAAVLAMANGQAVCAGRVEFLSGSEFAGLWGAGTLPAWRGRGLFRSLVGHRAATAAAHGFRYLQVDATDASRPILERSGFVSLAVTTPFTHPGHSRDG